MAEAILVVGLLASSSQLIEYSAVVIKRLHDFMTNVKELPSYFSHINNQLPILVGIVDSLRKRVSSGDFTLQSEHDLKRVVDALDKEIKGLDAVLCKILPSARASTWEKGVKAVKSVSAQKSVENFASVIQDYVTSLNAFQITHTSDQIKTIISSIEERQLQRQLLKPRPVRKPIWMLEYDSDEDFVGRDEIMNAIESRFAAMVNRAAVTGIGGVGKSRIAIQYCHEQRHREVETHIFWVHGGSRAKFGASHRKIARLLDLQGREDKEVDIMQLVRDHLSEDSSYTWVMVLDNADDHDLWLKPAVTRDSSENSTRPLIEYLPRCLHGRILITTRDSQLGYRLAEGKNEPIYVTRFGPEEASRLLRAKLSEGSSLSLGDAYELTAVLEYLPLTITQAAAYLNQIEITATDYLQLFRNGISDIPELLAESVDDPSRDRETSNSIFQTWRLSFEQISKHNSRAAEILSMMAMLDRQGISQDLIQKPNESPLQFRAAISKLKAFSFIVEEKKESSKYSMHRLVQLSTQNLIQHLGQLSFFQEAAISAVSLCCPSTADFKDWPTFVDLGSHVNNVLEYNAETKPAQINRANILHCFGHYAMGRGQEGLALKFLEEARTLREEHLGLEHVDTLTTKGLLGVTYNKLGKEHWRKSQQIQLEVLDKARRVLGFKHRLTLKSMSRLAITYGKGTKSQYCRDLQVEVLRLMEQELGLNDPDTLTEMSNLLHTLNRLDEWEKADEVGQLVLRLRSKVLGPAHPDTVTIMANLSWTYNAQRRWQEAVQLEEKVLELRLQALGPVHPKSLLAMSNLARTYRNQNRCAEAEQLQRQVVAWKTRVLGPDHRETIKAVRQLNAYIRASLLRVQRPPRGSSIEPRAEPLIGLGVESPVGSRAGSPAGLSDKIDSQGQGEGS